MYSWPGRFKPFAHQKATADFLCLNPRAYVLNEIGTGKTNATLWAADRLMELGHVKKALILTPLSTINQVWGNAIFEGLAHRSCLVLHDTADRRRNLFSKNADFYIINHEGFNIIAEDYVARADVDLLIIDELAVYRNNGTKLFKQLRQAIQRKPNTAVWGLTGTPTPTSPLNAWTQCRLVNPERVPPSFVKFQDSVVRKVSNFVWTPRPEAVQIVADAMQPAVRFTRDECLDLPPTLYQTRTVELSTMQRKHYKEMLASCATSINESDITAVNEAAKLTKLLQIVCGAVYDSEGEIAALDCQPRINELKEIVEGAGQKVIVFVPFKAPLKQIATELKKQWTCEVVEGGVSKSERDRIFTAFTTGADPHVLVANPGTMSHGLTLTEANTIVWFAPIYNNDIYNQANGRITRAGQKYTANIVRLCGSELEEIMYTKLMAKEKMQGALLETIKRRNQ